MGLLVTIALLVTLVLLLSTLMAKNAAASPSVLAREDAEQMYAVRAHAPRRGAERDPLMTSS